MHRADLKHVNHSSFIYCLKHEHTHSLTLSSHALYLFHTGAAHIGAMYSAFLAVATACGTPPMLAAVALGQLSNLMGCLTTYGIGSAPPYFGAGYVPQVSLLFLLLRVLNVKE